jgi:peptidoglycan hydrolase-like protein with peptidoglycan-binding domain
MDFNPGDADGQLGQRTTDAIKLYQKFAGIDVDGKASRNLLEDLHAVAETMAKGG